MVSPYLFLIFKLPKAGAKLLVASFPGLGNLKIKGKTGKERFLFEIEMAQREIQGRMLQEEVSTRRGERQVGGLFQ